MSDFEAYPVADTLTGAEIMLAKQAGTTKQLTAQDVADLAGGGGLVDQTLADSVTVTMPGESVKFAGSRTSGTITATSNCWISFDGDADAGWDELNFAATVVDSAGAGQASSAGLDVYAAADGSPTSAAAVMSAAGVSGDVNDGATFQLMPGESDWTQAYSDAGTPSDNHVASISLIASATRGCAVLAGDLVLSNGVLATGAAAGTLSSGATIAPTKLISFVSGTTDIDTITPPTEIDAGGGMVVLIPTGVWHTTTAGNVAIATTAVVSKALMLFYDTTTNKWYPSY